MTRPGTFETLLAEVGQAFLPLREAIGSADAFSGLLRKLGWLADDIPRPLLDLGAGVEALYDSLRRLLGDGGLNVGGGPGGGVSVEFSADDVARALGAVQRLIGGIRGIAGAPDSAIPESLRVDRFREIFPGQLVDYLVVAYLERFHPSLGFGLRTLGIIKSSYAPPAGNRPAYMHLALDLDELPRLLGGPSQVLKNAYRWGEPDFDFDALASQVDNLLMSFGVGIHIVEVTDSTATAVRGTPPPPGGAPATAVEGTVFERVQRTGPDTTRLAAVLRLMGVPGDGTGPPGLAVLPAFQGALAITFQVRPDIAVTISSDVDLQGGVALRVRPGQPVDMVLGFESGSAPVHAKGSIEARVERTQPGGEPTVILGSPGRTRLQYRAIAGLAGVRVAGDAADPFAEVELIGLEFVFEPSGADGFIGSIIPGGGVTMGADLAVGVSHRNGFYFRGAANLELQVPVHAKLGPVEVEALTISVTPSGDGLPIGLGATFKAELGPIKAVVEQIGMTANLAFKSGNDGNLGPVDLSLGFRPPKGIGLSVDAGLVAGGGYLYFDPDRGEYAGVLELEFAGLVELKAIGLISTRMPDGSKGFSLLIVITAEFGGGGIQLGFGFTLLAVGGLIGLNRGMNLEELVRGVRAGSIDSVMFPRDVVANAPRILSDLRRFFPPEEGTFLIGPMAKIGWGTPTLVSISLGVIVEIPPGNIAVLGVLRCVLPSSDLPLLVIQVAFVGALEPTKQRLWFYAELFDSRILMMTIGGGMGLLVAWGDNPELVLTVGGFHPSFKPPPLPFPVPPRLSIDILNQPGRLIRVTGYFAVTSNTVQFGARAEMRLGFGGFYLEGHLSFDALFRFSPFAFLIEISAGVTLKAFGVGVFGIDLQFVLEGPQPWRAHGRGSISLLFFEISADFDISWGEDNNPTLPPARVLPLLEAEIKKLEGWTTRLPTGGAKALVNLRPLDETDKLVLHPLGTLFIQQRAIPLGVRLDKVGQQRPGDGNRFTVEPAADSGLVRVSKTGDRFAMAQFQDMDDAAKLSRPAYETQDAGLELTAAQGAMESPRMARRSSRYEQIVIDKKRRQATSLGRRADAVVVPATERKRLVSVSPAVFDRLLDGSSTSRSALSATDARRRQPFPASETIQVTDQRFVVAYLRNNQRAFPPSGYRGQVAESYRNRTLADEALAGWVAVDPSLAQALHVIPESDATGTQVARDTWTPAVNRMPVAVADGGIVRLGTGTVLVAGGTGGTGQAAALFDPVVATWTATGAMTTGRRLHSTALLADGRVMVAGGVDAAGAPLGSSEVYQPIGGTWTATPGHLATARSGHRATALANGKVLVTGGTGPDGRALASAELFDPVEGTWSAAEPMTDARTGHQAVPLPNGHVLVIGGAVRTGAGEAALAYCERYDPTTGRWTPAASMTTPRAGHQATAFDDGDILVTGGDPTGIPVGGAIDPHGLASAERYDHEHDAWTPVAAMPVGRTRHRAVRLRADEVLVVGGTGGPSFAAGYRGAVRYHPGTNTWTAAEGMATGRADPAAVALADGRVLVAGGRERSGEAAGAATTDTAEIYTP
ncbi:DUF6603 domain-containing protein [Pseudonocardia acaciae]|uniref:DUF6603 domain-containing protein n=1 Tax=Pseudonocardia acaciae TaxID=551276 RepID=UPI00048E2688|nr:DUF6603 domain-containing protein [Pseudonocardia acaciae]